MKLRLIALISLLASFIAIAPANAAEGRVVTGVSAYYRVDLGYMVGWTLPSDTKGITSYTVTASPGGKTCSAGANAVKCIFSTSVLGFSNTYTFSVVANSASGAGPVSAASNSVKHASIPYAPLSALARATSDTSVDVQWVPDSNDGGAPLYGYTITWWPSSNSGDPISAEQRQVVVTNTKTTLSNLKPSTLYIVNVASCNAYGCNSADRWTYVSTTGPAGVSTIRPPKVVSGGSASTTCWNAVWDAGTAASTGSTFSRSTTKCPGITIDPALYPKVDPTATKLMTGPLATKFAQSVSFGGFSKTYSMKEWAATGGNNWYAYFSASSKSVTLGFTTDYTVTSTTPTVCTVSDRWVKFVAPGECVLNGSVAGNEIWLPSPVATARFTIVP
jgi:Fibronectin type III domain